MKIVGLYKGMLLVGCAYVFFIFKNIDDLSINVAPEKIKVCTACSFDDVVSSSVLTYDNKLLQKINSHACQIIGKNDATSFDERDCAVLREDKIPLYKNPIKKNGQYNYIRINIHSNIYSDSRGARIPQNVIVQLINAYRHIINFQSDVNEGNTLTVLFTDDGTLQYTDFDTGRRKFTVYNHKSDFSSDFCNEFGEGIQSHLMKTPIEGARISSQFGMRVHPISGYTKHHRGVDFAAPIGTPIVAAGDGRVVQLGHWGGYGNCITISHNNNLKTRYGHMSRYSSNVTPGCRVKRGQIIGFVGLTGRTTGAHLHFEVIENGRRINPMHVKLVSKKTELKNNGEFLNFKKRIDVILTSFNKNNKITQ